jgi:hypothetical protein
MFAAIGDLTINNIDPDWGAIVLLLGTMGSLGVAISLGLRRPRLSRIGKIAVIVAVIPVGVWVACRILLIFFPYLKYWRSLL